MLSPEAKRILAMIEPLPIEAKLAIVDQLLEDLQAPEDAVDRLWDRQTGRD